MKDEMASGRGSIYSVEKRTSVTATEPAPATGVRRAGAWFVHELHEILPPLTFFFVGFNLIVQTTNLIVANYSVAVGNFMLATTGALIVGKAVPVANATPLRSCPVDPADPVQDAGLLGRCVHRSAARGSSRVLARARPSAR